MCNLQSDICNLQNFPKLSGGNYSANLALIAIP